MPQFSGHPRYSTTPLQGWSWGVPGTLKGDPCCLISLSLCSWVEPFFLKRLVFHKAVRWIKLQPDWCTWTGRGQLRGRTIGLLQHTQACDLWKESRRPIHHHMAEHTWSTPHRFQGSRFSQMFAGKEMKIVCRLKHTWVSDSLYLAWPRVFLWTLGVARHVDESQNK